MLRYGRPEPDYSTSTTTSVTVTLPRAHADTAFFRLILDAEQRLGGPMPIVDLLVLSYLRKERKITTDAIASHLHKPDATIRTVLTKLIESGLVEAHGAARGQGRAYTLSAMVYRATGERAEYVRQAGFDAIQQEQMVLKYVDVHGKIIRSEAMELCRINQNQSKRLLKRLVDSGQLKMLSQGRGTFYIRP